MNKLKIKILILLSIIFIITSCSKNEQLYEDESFYMNTVITQKIYGENSTIAANTAKDKLSSIENKMSRTIENSLISSINKNSGKNLFTKLDKETYYVLNKSLYYSKVSSGAFDITIAPLVDIWGIGTDNPTIPDKTKLNNLLKLVDYNSLIIDDEKGASLKNENQSIDLGAVAKGYAGDEIIKIYKENNIKSAIINLGGNICTLGTKIDGTNWKVGIQNPRDDRNKYVGYVEVNNKCVVTSGDYERYFEENNNRYHHILDPTTGYPSDSGLYSASIISSSSIDADALSTSVFVLGLEKGLAILDSINDAEGIFITNEKKIYLTNGLIGKFILNKDVQDYEIIEKR